MKFTIRLAVLYLSSLLTAIFAYRVWAAGHIMPSVLLTILSTILTLMTVSLK
ncbi:hypothetical protein NWX26_004546 [Salmonella enterica]|nr:hypothetical protein [Salmonella enterica]EEO3523278.1 hypothetical protein [Salmonella enterica subsp. enterica serovar Cerro]EIE5051102.1 hypothetical protein [Salmonella enterica subsp. enterica serovar Java]EEC5201330.1 hypothetical protein [Salmonella enterica]EFT8166582.1 hypothetical protein [Salmonella enterica]